MPMFRYEATDRSGKTVVGAMDARDEGAVRARLASGGYTPTLIEMPGGARTPKPPPAYSGVPAGGADAHASAQRLRRGVSVSSDALGRFYRQMAVSIRSGVPLTQALPSVKASIRDRRMRRALDDIEDAVARGRPISEAMDRHPEAFSPGHVGLVRAGEGAGFLDRAFEELAVQAEADWGLQAATKFNIVLFLIKWAAVPFLVGWLVFMLLFMPYVQGGHTQQEVIAAVMNAVKWFLIAGAATTAVLNGLLPLLWRFARSTPLGDWVANLSSYLPLFGARRRRTDAVKTLSALSSAMSAGVPPTLCWQLAAEAADTPRYRTAMARQAGLVRQGAPLPDVLEATQLYDRDTVNMVRSGEVAGNMPEMLAQAVYYQREEAKHIASLTPWVIALIAYFVILLLAAALFVWAGSRVYTGMLTPYLNDSP